MPIYEYGCSVCETVIEKVTTNATIAPPQEISNRCESCGRFTRHIHRISAPAVVAHTPGNNPAFGMKDYRKPKDKDWKKRVMAGLNPAGKPLTDRVAASAAAWGVGKRT